MSATSARAPGRFAWAPWTDRRGRRDPLRAVVFGLLLLPGLWLAVRFALGMLGARSVNAAIHSTGFWAVAFLVASLMVTPAKAIFGLPQIIVVRRMVGNAALAYAAIHLVLYAADQNWRWLTVAAEIVKRFYLTIGLVALLGLVALGATSTDRAIRSMGPRWKRLHRLVYGIAVLALLHFVLQTKADVSLPLIFIGVFYWLMLWRVLPAGRDRTMPVLLGVGVAAGSLTVATEWVWYRFGTHVDPAKIVSAELSIDFGLGPGDMVLVLGLVVVGLLALWRFSLGRAGERAGFWIVLFAAGAAVNEAVVFAFGIDRYLEPGDWSFLYQDLAWAVLLGVLGVVRWRCGGRGTRHGVDGLAVACVAFQIMLSSNGLRGVEIAVAAAIAALWAVLAWQTWRETKLAALSWVPVALVLAYGVATQM